MTVTKSFLATKSTKGYRRIQGTEQNICSPICKEIKRECKTRQFNIPCIISLQIATLQNSKTAICGALPVMLSSKLLLPEMEVDYNSKSEQLLQGIQNLPISSQIEKLKARIDLIAAACQPWHSTMVEKRRLQHSEELLESNGSGSCRSNENAEGTRLGLANLCCTRGRFSADVWLEREGEKGGEGEGEQEKLYFRFPGPTLMGRGDGGVGGEDDGVAPPDPINEHSLNFFPLLSAAPSVSVTGSLRD
uniref:Uncharacterized protein n=1 Tax=Salix viminalis TaxID=40686 RepID=A0A6N2M054_SALVM